MIQALRHRDQSASAGTSKPANGERVKTGGVRD
jgi:hypothetical protein